MDELIALEGSVGYVCARCQAWSREMYVVKMMSGGDARRFCRPCMVQVAVWVLSQEVAE